MPEPDPARAEVALNLGKGERLILRCSFRAVGKMLPVLLDAPPEVQQRRFERLQVNQRAFGREVPLLDEWNWNQHLLGAAAAFEVETVARCIAILAEEHHPDMTPQRVMEASPGWAQVAPVFSQLIFLYHYKPGEEPPQEEAGAAAPFAAIERLLGLLSTWRSPTASKSNGSAA